MEGQSKKEKEEKGRQAAIDGFAHEHIVVGILMKRYKNVSLVDLQLSPYDIIIVSKNDETGLEDIIRAQVKTAKESINFKGGTRGGVDRFYKSGVKEYTQSPAHSDVIIGIHPNENQAMDSFDLYFLPTIAIENLAQKSISIRKIISLKNNYEILEKCKNEKFVIEKFKEFGLLK